jgi:hypothetical protein
VKVASGVLQLLGLSLTLLGVAVVRSWLKQAAGLANDVKQDLPRRWAQRRGQLRHWWARRRGHGVVLAATATSTATSSVIVSVTVTRTWPDRTTITERDWLAVLDDRVQALYEHLDQANERHAADSKEWDRRLQAQRDTLRAELVAATQDGWELIVLGVALSAVGTVLGIWA